MEQMILISRDKLILMDRLLKDVINIYRLKDEKASMTAKFKAQRSLISILSDDNNTDLYINKLKRRIEKETIFTGEENDEKVK